jgi:hypothetical protein
MLTAGWGDRWLVCSGCAHPSDHTRAGAAVLAGAAEEALTRSRWCFRGGRIRHDPSLNGARRCFHRGRTLPRWRLGSLSLPLMVAKRLRDGKARRDSGALHDECEGGSGVPPNR